MMYMDVDAALSEVPVNIAPLTDDTDFKSLETSVAYNASGMALYWHFVTTAGSYTCTQVTPTTSGTYDWAHQGQGMYSIEIPASGGASINNDTEGYGWFTGFATGVLPWRGPTICFRASPVNDALVDGGDLLDVSVTQFGGTNGTFSSGRPEVNTTHRAGTALATPSLLQAVARISRGNTGVIFHAYLFKATGDPFTGISSASSGLVGKRMYEGDPGNAGAPISISFEDLSVGFGVYEQPTDGGHLRFYEVDSTNMPGLYEFHIHPDWSNPTQAFRALRIRIGGVSGMADNVLIMSLTGTDEQNNETGGIRSIHRDTPRVIDRMLAPFEYRPLNYDRMAEIFDKATGVYYVDASNGDDSNSGLAPGDAFATVAKLATVWQPNNVAIFSDETHTFSSEVALPHGMVLIGTSKTSTILYNDSATALDGSEGGCKFINIKVRGSVGHAVGGFRDVTAWNSAFQGVADIIVPNSNYLDSHNRLYNCTLSADGTSSQDGVTASGGITDLYNCDVTLNCDTSPSNTIRSMGNGTIVRVIGGNLVNSSSVSEVNGLQATNGGMIILLNGATVTTPTGKNDLRDSAGGATDHTGRIIVDSTAVFDAGKVVGSYTMLPTVDTASKVAVHAVNSSNAELAAASQATAIETDTQDLQSRLADIEDGTTVLRADDRDGAAVAKETTAQSADDQATSAATNALTAASNSTTILARLGAWTGSARNTILGAFQALFRKDSDASVPSDINADLGSGAGSANNTTDSVEAIRDRGDAAWTTGSGGGSGGGDATEAKQDQIIALFQQGIPSVTPGIQRGIRQIVQGDAYGPDATTRLIITRQTNARGWPTAGDLGDYTLAITIEVHPDNQNEGDLEGTVDVVTATGNSQAIELVFTKAQTAAAAIGKHLYRITATETGDTENVSTLEVGMIDVQDGLLG